MPQPYNSGVPLLDYYLQYKCKYHPHNLLSVRYVLIITIPNMYHFNSAMDYSNSICFSIVRKYLVLNIVIKYPKRAWRHCFG